MGRRRLLIGIGVVFAVVGFGRLVAGGEARAVALPTIATALVVDQGTHSGVLVGGDGTVALFEEANGQLGPTFPLAPTGDVASAMALAAAEHRAIVGTCTMVMAAGAVYGHVSIIGTATGRVERTIPLPICPLAIASDARHGHLIVAGVAPTCTPAVFRVAKTPMWSALSVRCARGPAPIMAGSLAPVTQDGRTGRLYSTGSGIGLVALLDTRSGAILHTTYLPPVAALVVDDPTGRILVAGYGATGTGTVSVIDAARGALLSQVAVGQRPVALALEAATARLFIANDGDGTVSVIDARHGRLLRTVPVRAHPEAFAVDTRWGHVFVASVGPRDAEGNPRGRGSVSVLDARSGGVVRTVSVGPVPAALAVVAHGRRVLVLQASPGGGVSVLDSQSGRPLRTLPVCGWPQTWAVDPLTGRAWVGSSVFAVSSDPCGPPIPILDGLLALRYFDTGPPPSGRLSLLPPAS